MPLRGSCKGKGKSCSFFEVKQVEFMHPNCTLAPSAIGKIECQIEGIRPPGRSGPHFFTVTLTEQGKPFRLQFANPAAPTIFKSGKLSATGYIDSSNALNLTFLVRINPQLARSYGGKSVVEVKFSHTPNGSTSCFYHTSSPTALQLILV